MASVVRTVVHVHEVIEQRAGGVLRCSPDGDASRRWLELPQWLFDRAACLAIHMAASPHVDTAALIALKTCLADASGAGLCGGPLSNASASGAGRSSCNQNQRAARATQGPASTQPSSRRQAIRSFRSARREHPTAEFEWQQLPEKTRETVTGLMVRLLVAHQRRDRGPGSTGGRGDV